MKNCSASSLVVVSVTRPIPAPSDQDIACHILAVLILICAGCTSGIEEPIQRQKEAHRLREIAYTLRTTPHKEAGTVMRSLLYPDAASDHKNTKHTVETLEKRVGEIFILSANMATDDVEASTPLLVELYEAEGPERFTVLILYGSGDVFCSSMSLDDIELLLSISDDAKLRSWLSRF